jgi:hypothetical protein
VAAAFLVGLAAWAAAGGILVAGSGDLADGRVGAARLVLAAHLVGLGLFPFAVTASAWQLLPVMLRNRLPSPARLWLLTGLLGGGFLLAPGVAAGHPELVWAGSVLVAAGLALAVAELTGLVRRAPRGKTLVVSRAGVLLSAANAVAAMALGAAVFADDAATPLGIPYERAVLVHLALAALGWLTALIVTVGRVLAPMLALAPARGARRFPALEVAVVAAVWLLLAGIASGVRALAAVGLAGLAAALAPFLVQLAGVLARRRSPAVEGPLAHLAAGGLLLVEAGILGALGLADAVEPRRAATAAAFLLVAGWAAGVIVGHAGKLVSLAVWNSWPPGPRPKQADLYPLRLWHVEALLFAAGAQAVAAGVLAESHTAAAAGAAALAASAAIALAAAAESVRRAWGRPDRG